MGIQTHLASRTFVHRSGHGLRRRGRRGDFQDHRRRQNVEGTSRVAQRERTISGNPARAAWRCTRFFSIQKIRNEFTSRFPRRGAFRTDDGGKTWKPINKGLKSPFELARSRCGSRPLRSSHRDASHRGRTCCSCKNIGTSCARDNAGDMWNEVSGNLPTDFGFPIDVHAHEPNTIYVVPIKSDSEHYPPDGKLRVYRSKTGGNEWEALTKGLPQKDCYVNVLRDAMAWTHWIRAAFISARPADRFIARPTAAIHGTPSCTICRRCCRSKCSHCHDSSRSAISFAQSGAHRDRSSDRSPSVR